MTAPIRLRLAPKPKGFGRPPRKEKRDPDLRENPASSFSAWIDAKCPRQALDDEAPPQQNVETMPRHAGHTIPPAIEADDVEF